MVQSSVEKRSVPMGSVEQATPAMRWYSRRGTTLDGCHRERRPNSEFYLKSPAQLAALFADVPEALSNTLQVAECCSFNLATDLDYLFPDYETPAGETQDGYLARLCWEELPRRYSPLQSVLRRRAAERLGEELRLIAKHRLAGFFLQYRDLLGMAAEIADELATTDPAAAPRGGRDRRQPGRGRGSSVSSIVCYLLSLSHVDPVATDLFLGRFLNDELASVPDIDLDFPRAVRAAFLNGSSPPATATPPSSAPFPLTAYAAYGAGPPVGGEQLALDQESPTDTAGHAIRWTPGTLRRP